MNSQRCYVCLESKLDPVLNDREDFEYGVKTRNTYVKCGNKSCGHVQVNPSPHADSVKGFYGEYSTHHSTELSRLGRLIHHFQHPPNESAFSILQSLGADKNHLHILDFGCGGGALIANLQEQGWTNSVGYDFDPKARAFVESQGFTCFEDLESIEQGSLDVIFLNHVIEHLPDPKGSINELLEKLKPDGIIVLRTPNARSVLARLCGTYWRGWETPRHLHIFTPQSLKALFLSFNECHTSYFSTSEAMLVPIAIGSIPKQFRRIVGLKFLLAGAFIGIGWLGNLIMSGSGEELVLVARKEAKNS